MGHFLTTVQPRSQPMVLLRREGKKRGSPSPRAARLVFCTTNDTNPVTSLFCDFGCGNLCVWFLRVLRVLGFLCMIWRMTVYLSLWVVVFCGVLSSLACWWPLATQNWRDSGREAVHFKIVCVWKSLGCRSVRPQTCSWMHRCEETVNFDYFIVLIVLDVSEPECIPWCFSWGECTFLTTCLCWPECGIKCLDDMMSPQLITRSNRL